MIVRHCSYFHCLLLLLICNSAYSLLSTPSCGMARPTSYLSQSAPLEVEEEPSQRTERYIIDQINLSKQLISYSFYWESLLTKEYQDTLAELQIRKKSYTRSMLESSGLSLFNAVATPETELYGEKIVRISLLNQSHKYDHNGGGERLREKFKRGDVLVMTPEIQFRGKDIAPREGLVMDVGHDYLTLGVGSSWPAGVMEMRKHDNYYVRLDKSISSVPLRAQRMSLDKLRKGRAGHAANSIVQLFYDNSSRYLDGAQEIPSHFNFDGPNVRSIDDRVKNALDEAMSHMPFKPNQSQQDAVVWALKRKLALIRGPPGTGKTRVAALLISTAIKMELKSADENGDETSNIVAQKPRILAVTHSNGAADVLVQALLDMNVPAVRGGRPASVSPSIQHRTIAALAERLPEVVKLRQQASDPSLDKDRRQAAIYDSKKSLNDAQEMITKTAPVIVTSCIGAQQLLSTLENDVNEDVSTFQTVVLDEAAQTTEPALVCALTSARAEQVILVGDTQQLPPTVTTEDAELRKTIGISPMERLLNVGLDEFVLKEQYRMPESLLKHPNMYFYKGEVEVAKVGGADPALPAPKGFPWPSKEPLAFLDVGNDSETVHQFSGRSNRLEVQVILDIVERVINAGEIEAENIAIITPYSKQVQLFRTELNNASLMTVSKMSNVEVGTVDSFQGQEKDLVLFSSVRSNLLREMGFLRDARRLNVAITRARKGLIVVGDSKVLNTCPHWRALIRSCSDRCCMVTHSEYMAKTNYNLMNRGSSDNDGGSLDLELNKEDKFFGLFSWDDEDDLLDF